MDALFKVFYCLFPHFLAMFLMSILIYFLCIFSLAEAGLLFAEGSPRSSGVCEGFLSFWVILFTVTYCVDINHIHKITICTNIHAHLPVAGQHGNT